MGLCQTGVGLIHPWIIGQSDSAYANIVQALFPPAACIQQLQSKCKSFIGRIMVAVKNHYPGGELNLMVHRRKLGERLL